MCPHHCPSLPSALPCPSLSPTFLPSALPCLSPA
jgi:hypothetical protein